MKKPASNIQTKPSKYKKNKGGRKINLTEHREENQIMFHPQKGDLWVNPPLQFSAPVVVKMLVSYGSRIMIYSQKKQKLRKTWVAKGERIRLWGICGLYFQGSNSLLLLGKGIYVTVAVKFPTVNQGLCRLQSVTLP